VAARIRRQLRTDVDMVHGSYGQFQVLVDNAVLIDGGSLAFVGVLPSVRNVVEAVRAKLASAGPAA
jgi:hypothetical protein